MKANAKNKQSTYIIIAVMAALVMGALIMITTLGGGGSSAAAGQVVVSQSGNSFTASSSYESPVERWQYAVRDDDTCNSSVFSDGGRQIGDNIPLDVNKQDNTHIYVIYGTNRVSLESPFNNKYVCFNALLESGDWVKGGTQLTFNLPDTTPDPTPDTAQVTPDLVDTADAPDDHVCDIEANPGITCANLSNRNFYRTNLSGADFFKADFTGANLSQATGLDTARLPDDVCVVIDGQWDEDPVNATSNSGTLTLQCGEGELFVMEGTVSIVQD